MAKKLFPCLIQLLWKEAGVSPIFRWAKFKFLIVERRRSSLWKSVFVWLHSQFSLRVWGVVNNVLKGSIGLEQSRCLLLSGNFVFVPHQFKCPYPNQVFKYPLLFYFFFCKVLRMRHLSLLGTVTCGVHSVPLAGGQVRGRHCCSRSEWCRASGWHVAFLLLLFL